MLASSRAGACWGCSSSATGRQAPLAGAAGAHARRQQQRGWRGAARVAAAAAEEREQTPAEREREVRQEVTRRIKALGEQRRFKEAVQELAGLAALGVQPDTQAATALLAACTRSRDMKMAQSVFDQLFGDFLQPDEVTFAVMLRGYGGQSPPDWARLDAVLSQMKVTYGLDPTSTSYNALLDVCSRTNDSDRALDVIDRMAADGVEPDERTWDIASRKRAWRSYMRKQRPACDAERVREAAITMSKRRATDELFGGAGGSSKRHGAADDRAAEFAAKLRALNAQFAGWVHRQAAGAPEQLWSDGAADYVRHADTLLEEYADVLRGGQGSSPPLASNLFGTPAPAAAAANGGDHAPGPLSASGASSGRKSVTFAPSTGTFGAAGGVAATPGGAPSNTANAGHTPAPPSGLSFRFGTPGGTPGSEAPSPAPPSKFGVTPDAPPSSSGFTFGVAAAPSPGFGATPGSADAAAAPAAAPAGGGFSFGVAASSSSGAAGGSSAADAGAAASGGSLWGAGGAAGSAGATPAAAATGFSFGATPSPGAAPAATPASAGGFSFGATPAATPAAAAGGAPAFGFAATPAPAAFKFPPPAAPAAGDGAADAAGAGGGGGGGGEEAEEGPPKFKPEIKVDESVWRVLFSSKARLHVRVKRDGGATDWEPRGVGMLTVRQPKEGAGDKTYVMFSTDVGKQLVSSQLMSNSAVMTFPNNPKKCRMSLMVLQYDLPPAGADPAAGVAASAGPKHQLQVCMISLATAEKVEELSKVVDQHKPK
ncbi:hypothetical protein HT031_000454 [Scenedesmus sp. PABB004]|nr:hypothetical protein HT031_000454 [Scenedesmus sp. PABB004]